jgi:hypothetical protein
MRLNHLGCIKGLYGPTLTSLINYNSQMSTILRGISLQVHVLRRNKVPCYRASTEIGDIPAVDESIPALRPKHAGRQWSRRLTVALARWTSSQLRTVWFNSRAAAAQTTDNKR